MTSLWLDGREPIRSDSLEGDSCDDVVVGAGLTGLMTALLLSRSGRGVVVLEAREVGAVTTGNTTGKLSLLQGTKYTRLTSRHPESLVRAYVEANLEGQQWLLRYCEEHDVPVQRRPAVTYAPDDAQGLKAARDEHEAATAAGLGVRWADDLDVPFPHRGGTVLEDQAQLDPMDLLEALVESVRAEGGRIVTGARVQHVSRLRSPTVRLEDGRSIRCEHVILATGTPILDRGLYFAKLEPGRSYALAYDYPDAPELMMLSASGPTRSVRDAPATSGRALLIGGDGHVVGRTRSERAHLNRLRDWTAEYFPGAVETHHWSAQDYTSHDGVPYVGGMPRSLGKVYVATGYAKWGLTNGVAAALDITAQILDGRLRWADRMHHRVTRPRSALEPVRMNAGVAVSGLQHVLDAALRGRPETPPKEGTGEVGRSGVVPVGVSTVNGRTCAVQALCTHLGGVLAWNDAEKSWDCPLHGSRFSPTGEVLEGPATRALPRRGPDGPTP
ncbi:FAD-dependent oxidoreductase [Luteipulveratus flavus]|uniref:FAD-dependent oxidoreductase n=1 Tax=Luteipulveratus flavus TaxID=3031728 RepID=A0ABT6C7I1_9MICO|nr:FAD-dependent oxidoreductase [Luteipulveratus sp. YIM 133296]MDF8264862.1 FAD-dependent oxidoreductase [Luteipulveratus sp. YIM 133296]